MTDFKELVTEQARDDLSDLDLMETREIVAIMATEEAQVPQAVLSAGPRIAPAVDVIVDRLRGGGRLIYVGAGTAGRLGLLDAAECRPTFGTDQVVGVLAGGLPAFGDANEEVEDDPEAGAADLKRVRVGSVDAVVGISASGRTPYVLGAIEHADAVGAATIGVCCNPGMPLSEKAQYPIEVIVGPEVISGSTRLKAGTAQKLVLNILSTVSMVRLGNTFGNLMVNVQANNEKLRDRALRVVTLATGASVQEAEFALREAEGDARAAIVMLLMNVAAPRAQSRLKAAGGSVRRSLEEDH